MEIWNTKRDISAELRVFRSVREDLPDDVVIVTLWPMVMTTMALFKWLMGCNN